ncbi:precorrin-3B synthase [Corynebacterium diphtheriae]
MSAMTFQKSADVKSAAVLIAHPDRSRSDMCPGALKLHHANDGAIGRVRFPGGRVRASQWEDIARISDELGDGSIHITIRGNMQFRGVSDEAAFADVVEAAGFLPSRRHDKIRNILCSPLSPELWTLTDDLDQCLLENDVVAGLSGRTLFGFDAGSGDIVSQNPDFGVVYVDGAYQLILGGKTTSVAIADSDEVATILTAAAEIWQNMREIEWRLHESPVARQRIAEELHERFDVVRREVAVPRAQGSARPIGWISADDGTVTLGAGLRFGFLTSKVARILAAVGADTSITPWASLVIHGLKEDEAEAVTKVLAPQGLIFDAHSPWLKVTACTGLPGCQKSLTNTQQDATTLVQSGDEINGLVHFSGCDRRCGHPLSHHTEYVAVGDGEYEVSER